MSTATRIALPLVLALAAAPLAGCLGIDDGDPSSAESESTGEAVSALAADCENGANGFFDIPDNLTGTMERQMILPSTGRGGLEVTIQAATVAGTRRGWALLTGPTIPGDKVWMNWSLDGGDTTHVKCGPFTVTKPNMSKTSAAKRTSTDTQYVFQACGQAVGASQRCTTWW